MSERRRSRRGQLTKRGENWQVRVSLGRDAHGKRLYYNRIVRGTKKEAERHLTEKLSELDTDTFVTAGNSTLTQFVTEWLHTAMKAKLTRKSHDDYTSLLTRHVLPVLGSQRIDRIGQAGIQNLYNELTASGLSPRTVRYIHSVLHNALEHAVRWRRIARNPTAHVILPRKVPTVRRPLTATEARALMAAAQGCRYGLLWQLLLETGMRPGEGEALQWADFVGDALQVHRSLARHADGSWAFKEPKTHKGRRTIPISPSLAAALREHLLTQAELRQRGGSNWNDGDLIFCNDVGGPVDHRVLVRRYFHPMLERAGLPRMSPYALRHACASLLFSTGTNVKVVSERLGHANVSFTLDTYVHALPGMQESATDRLAGVLGPF
jgi:integrase